MGHHLHHLFLLTASLEVQIQSAILDASLGVQIQGAIMDASLEVKIQDAIMEIMDVAWLIAKFVRKLGKMFVLEMLQNLAIRYPQKFQPQFQLKNARMNQPPHAEMLQGMFPRKNADLPMLRNATQ